MTTLVAVLLLTGAAAKAESIAVGRFSVMSPGGEVTGWEPMTFDKIPSHTRYVLVNDDGRTVLRADADASASGLVRKIDVDPTEYPMLSWTWKVGRIVSKGDVTRKSGDDYAARIYITFAEKPEQRSFLQRTAAAAIKMVYGKAPPSAALAYVWGNRSEAGTIHPNPFTERLQMIIVESGPAHVNQWREARRNIVGDFRRAFGRMPPPISGIAIMTDTDNTKESVTAWYGDIELRRWTDD
jgi:hypothetical protein